MFLYWSIPILKSNNLKINAFELFVEAVKEQTDCFVCLLFSRKLKNPSITGLSQPPAMVSAVPELIHVWEMGFKLCQYF